MHEDEETHVDDERVLLLFVVGGCWVREMLDVTTFDTTLSCRMSSHPTSHAPNTHPQQTATKLFHHQRVFLHPHASRNIATMCRVSTGSAADCWREAWFVPYHTSFTSQRRNNLPERHSRWIQNNMIQNEKTHVHKHRVYACSIELTGRLDYVFDNKCFLL